MTKKEALKDVEVSNNRLVTTRVFAPDFSGEEPFMISWAIGSVYTYRGVRFCCLKSDGYAPMEYETTCAITFIEKRTLTSSISSAKEAIDRNFDKVAESIAKAKLQVPTISVLRLISYGLL